MDILARPAVGRDIPEDAFADIVTVPVSSVEWVAGGKLLVSFEGDLTPAERIAVILRITSCDAREEQLRAAAAAFLTVDAPTAAQILAQVRRLTRLALLLDDD